MKSIFRYAALAGLGIALSLSSCKKDKEEDNTTTENLVAQDQTEASSTIEDIGGTTQQMMDENETVINGRMATGEDTIVKTRGVDDCAVVTIIKSQKKITVDFGTTGCQGRNGRIRKGKWIINYTAHWRNPGAVVNIAFDNFAFRRPGQGDFIQVANTSTKKITTLSATNGVFEFKKEVNMATTLPTGQTRTHTGTRYVTWNTNQTLDRYDDLITLKTTSTETGTDRRGRAYSVAVIEPVLINTACWLQNFYKPVSGIVEISKIGRTKTINYGDGTCGGIIEIDVAGKKTTVGEGE